MRWTLDHTLILYATIHYKWSILVRREGIIKEGTPLVLGQQSDCAVQRYDGGHDPSFEHDPRGADPSMHKSAEASNTSLAISNLLHCGKNPYC